MENNIQALVKKTNNKNCWKDRLDALNELKSIDCQQRKDVIIRLAKHDRVWDVKHAAFLAAQSLNLTINGKPVQLGKRDTGYKHKDYTKTFSRVKRESNMDEFNLQLFKEKFLQINPEMFDVMKYEKDSTFNDWIENIYSNLPKKKE